MYIYLCSWSKLIIEKSEDWLIIELGEREFKKKKKKTNGKTDATFGGLLLIFLKIKKTQNLKRTERGVSHTLTGMDFFLDGGWVPHQTGRIWLYFFLKFFYKSQWSNSDEI